MFGSLNPYVERWQIVSWAVLGTPWLGRCQCLFGLLIVCVSLGGPLFTCKNLIQMKNDGLLDFSQKPRRTHCTGIPRMCDDVLLKKKKNCVFRIPHP